MDLERARFNRVQVEPMLSALGCAVDAGCNLAIAIAAKASSANVSFVGSCLNADYFSATYIKVE